MVVKLPGEELWSYNDDAWFDEMKEIIYVKHGKTDVKEREGI